LDLDVNVGWPAGGAAPRPMICSISDLTSAAYAQADQDLGRGPVDAEQAEQQMLGADVAVAKSRRLSLGNGHRAVGGEMREFAFPDRDREGSQFPRRERRFMIPASLPSLPAR
jgi:hypothetical protein